MTERHRLAPSLERIHREGGTPDQWKAAAEAIRQFADEIEKGIYGLVRVATITHVRTRKAGGIIMGQEEFGKTKVITTLPGMGEQQQFEKIRRVLEGRDEIDLAKR